MGNITTGGTGKTPVVEFIARYLREKGKRAAIVSRGYAARIRQGESAEESLCNDEHLLFQENIPDIPSILHKDRVKGGLEAIQRFQAECLVLDDGFQHLRLQRDLDIVIIDALNPFGFGQVLPRGLLREPLSGLKRSGVFVLSHVDQCSSDEVRSITDRLHEIAGHVPIVETIHKPVWIESAKGNTRLDIHCLEGKKVFAFCAIGNPLSFRKSIEGLGAELSAFRAFPDHHVYTDCELKQLQAEAQRVKPDAIVITQKDKVKVKNSLDMWSFPLWTLKIEICIVKGLDVFEDKINAVLN